MLFFQLQSKLIKSNNFSCIRIAIALKTEKILASLALKINCTASAIASKIVAAQACASIIAPQVPTSGFNSHSKRAYAFLLQLTIGMVI